MTMYSVLLRFPDTGVYNYPDEQWFGIVQAPSPKDAVVAARRKCATEYRRVRPTELQALLVIEGAHTNVNPER